MGVWVYNKKMLKKTKIKLTSPCFEMIDFRPCPGSLALPSERITLKWRRTDIDATSIRRIAVSPTSLRRYVPAAGIASRQTRPDDPTDIELIGIYNVLKQKMYVFDV